MRILGPDGQPIESGPPVLPQVRQIVEDAKKVAANGETQSALQHMVYAFQHDVSSNLVIDTTIELLEEIVRMAGATNSQELEIFRNIKNHREDPSAYQQAGHWFAQSQQFIVSLPYFRRAKELLAGAQNELAQAVGMGIAQVLMSLGAYEEAVNAFHNLNDTYGSLPPWLLLELAECYALLGQVDAAEMLYESAPAEAFEQFAEFPALPMIREEVGDLIARVRDFAPFDGLDDTDDMEDSEEPGPDEPDGDLDETGEVEAVEGLQLCDWHYVQTRGILIEMNRHTDPGPDMVQQAEAGADPFVPEEGAGDGPKPSGRFVYFEPSEEDVAYIVGVSAAFLDAKGYAPTRLLWLGQSSEPLARLFAQWWEVEPENVREYRHGDNTEDEKELALLVMSHSYDIGNSLPVGAAETDDNDALYQMAEEQYVDLMQAKAGMIAYALDLRWTERQQMTPDVAGFMTQQCILPWETRFQMNEADETMVEIPETRSPEQVAEDIAKKFPPSETCDEIAAELMEHFSACSDLILDHRDGTLARRSMETHSPIKSPRWGF